MSWQPSFQFALPLAATATAVTVALIVLPRRGVPGQRPFVWLLLAVAWWAFTAALDMIVDALPARLLLGEAQYVGIAAVAPLWFLFAQEYARANVWNTPTRRLSLWVLPIVTMAMAFTNDRHHLLWRAIVPSGDALIYVHGPWFWLVIAYSYVLVAGGSLLIIGALRQLPAEFRGQSVALLFGVASPWAGNFLYVIGVHPSPGFDLTPVGFSVSGFCFAWGMFRHQLLDVVPIARARVLDAMSEAVVVLDPRMRVVDVNAAATRLIGHRRDWFGQPVGVLFPWWRDVPAVGSGAPRSTFISPDGSEQHLEVDVTPIQDGRRGSVGWLVLIRDVSARVTGERERLALDRRLLEQQKLQSLRVVAAGMAHDFNNLLASIVGNADLVAMHLPPDPDLRQRLETIVSGAQRAADIVEEMLAYAGEGRGVSEPIDLEALTRESVQLAEGSIARGLRVRYEPVQGLPAVYGDAMQIGQAVLNLVINAVEAVQPEGGTITVRVGQEELTGQMLSRLTFGGDAAPGRYVFVDVRDEGPGMDEATMARIFDPFFTTKPSGHGLGLAAVQGIVRGHGGALRVESTPGAGSSFRIWLPVSETCGSAASAVPDEGAERTGALDPAR